MLGFLNSRRGLATSAAVVIGAIVLFVIVTTSNWRSLIDGESTGADATPPVAASQPASPPVQSASKETPESGSVGGGQGKATMSAQPQASGAAPSGTDKDSGTKPTFDIVRIEPTGDSVIAARGMPNADVVLLDGGVPIAHAKSDANGQVALLPPPLKPGEHSLMLTMALPGQADVVSSQSIVVSVPEQPKTAAMVALIQPNQPASILSGPVAGRPSVSDGTGPADKQDGSPVAIGSVEVEGMGSFYATGRAAPGSHCRIYLNGSLVATVTADGKGVWSLQIKRGMKPGKYAVRADQIEGATGKVTARAEVPFEYPRTAASSLRKGLLKGTQPKLARAGTVAAPGADQANAGKPRTPDSKTTALRQVAAADPVAVTDERMRGADALTPTVISELVTAKVTRGDSLWQISRKILGQGFRYTQIYNANSQQIKDPRLIYPGQIFVMPQTGTL